MRSLGSCWLVSQDRQQLLTGSANLIKKDNTSSAEHAQFSQAGPIRTQSSPTG